MAEAAKPWLPHLKSAIKCETDAMLRYSKKAKAVYVDGRLVPYDRERYESL
jgi:hypothetical protein